MPLKVDPHVAPNRFSGGGIARVGEDFTDRDGERLEIARSLQTPRAHLVVAGHRRIGKSSLLLAVRDDLVAKGHPILYVDLWTASSIEDMTTRLSAEATAVLGRRWKETVKTFAQRLKLKFEFSDVGGGLMVPVPTIEFRDAPLLEQRQRLVDALDTLEVLAAKRKTHLGVIIDEFQEIERLGSEGAGARAVSAMRMVRAAVQHHRHVTYVFAGSDRRLISKLHTPATGALHNLARRYEIGPIPTNLFASWLDDEFAKMGIRAMAMGIHLITAVGPRTRDVRTLAETTAELARNSPTVTAAMISDAMHAIVEQRRPMYEADWKRLTVLQQNVLRATAGAGRGLMTSETRKQYSLGDTSRVAKTLEALESRDVLLREAESYAFDDPFFRGWVITATLPDVGIRLPITHIA